jgi:hypothetical protein
MKEQATSSKQFQILLLKDPYPLSLKVNQSENFYLEILMKLP